MTPRQISLAHLDHMTDAYGLFEHALLAQPRTEHGYCVDDVARGLIVTVREAPYSDVADRLARAYLDFIAGAQDADGRMRNRRNARGEWTDAPSTRDAWGRAVWGLGVTVGEGSEFADEALEMFDRSSRHRSEHSRSMIFSALGAAELLSAMPDHVQARSLLTDAIRMIDGPGMHASWPWPEARLRYANASLVDVVLAGGNLLDDPRLVDRGLELLAWLVSVEIRDGRVSVTPVGGWSRGETRPGYDQQPIEVSALADAAMRAYCITGDSQWANVVAMCAAWFDGDNDASVPMADHARGAGYDGLERGGRNENQGAESTLAMLSTLQQARRLVGVTV